MKNRELKIFSLLSLIGILFPLAAQYVPLLSVLIIFYPAIFVIMGGRFHYNKKLSIVSYAITSLVVTSLLNNDYAINIFFTMIVPGFLLGVFIGSFNRRNLERGLKNSNAAFLSGVFLFFGGVVLVYLYQKLLFNQDILKTTAEQIKEMLKESNNIMMANKASMPNFDVDDIIDNVMVLLPGIYMVKCVLLAVISYYIGLKYLCNFYPGLYERDYFIRFRLPNKALISSIVFYLMILAAGAVVKELKSDEILMNLQFVFGTLFALQGLAVFIYLLKRANKLGNGFKIAIAIFVLLFSGVFGLSIFGIIDCVVDFRKLRKA